MPSAHEIKRSFLTSLELFCPGAGVFRSRYPLNSSGKHDRITLFPSHNIKWSCPMLNSSMKHHHFIPLLGRLAPIPPGWPALSNWPMET